MTTDQIVINGESVEAIAPFDYSQLESEARIVVQQKTGEIRERVESMRRSGIEIGQRLREVKAKLKHGEWGLWLASEFRWSDQTALNMINVAEMADQTPKILEFEDRFARSALTTLAAPSTPPAARQAALELAEAGEKVTSTMAQQLIAEHKPEKPAPKPLPETPAELAERGWSFKRMPDDKLYLVNTQHGGATAPYTHADEAILAARDLDRKLTKAKEPQPPEEQAQQTLLPGVPEQHIAAAPAAPAAPAPPPVLTPMASTMPPALTPLTPSAGDDQALIQAAAMLLYTRKLVALAQRAWDALANPHMDQGLLPVVALDEAAAEAAARLALASPALRAQAGMLTFGASVAFDRWGDTEGDTDSGEEEIAA